MWLVRSKATVLQQERVENNVWFVAVTSKYKNEYQRIIYYKPTPFIFWKRRKKGNQKFWIKAWSVSQIHRHHYFWRYENIWLNIWSELGKYPSSHKDPFLGDGHISDIGKPISYTNSLVSRNGIYHHHHIFIRLFIFLASIEPLIKERDAAPTRVGVPLPPFSPQERGEIFTSKPRIRRHRLLIIWLSSRALFPSLR